jgi:subtilisin family serine protease
MRFHTRRTLGAFLFCLSFGAHFAAGAHTTGQPPEPAASHTYPASRAIPGRYIVIFKAHVKNPEQEAQSMMRSAKGRVHQTFNHALKGFSADIPEAALQGMKNNPNIESIEPDLTVQLNQTSPQNQAPWGLDRIDQVDRPLNTQYFFNYTGAGISAFVIDSGIRGDHLEFTGRLLPGYSVVADTNGTNDCNGHGTHVAGTLGGSTYGVAKLAQLVPVRVLNCAGSGTLSGVIAGIDWAAGTSLRPAVANLSLGSSKSIAFNAAIAGAVAKGITVVVAAGNSAANACNYSPSSEPSAITVGASTSADARASYSNYGTCVDVFAPGSSITSAWISSNTSTNTISGTSMASPHVAGVAALALQANPQATPAGVVAFLTANATSNRLTSVGTGSPNKLIFSLASGAPAEVPVQTVAIKSLVASYTLSKRSWQAFVTASVRDVSTGLAVANAKVSGTFSPGGATSCITASTGSCKLSSTALANTTASTSFSVTSTSGTNLSYDASQNSATQVIISKP